MDTIKKEMIETIERLGCWLEEHGMSGLMPEEVELLKRAKAESGYLPIDTMSVKDKTMFVAIAIDVEGFVSRPYTTDPYCVWKEGDKFVRWPHKFPPTHWLPLPKFK